MITENDLDWIKGQIAQCEPFQIIEVCQAMGIPVDTLLVERTYKDFKKDPSDFRGMWSLREYIERMK